MKRAMKLLARMYPSSWRERYGAEFDALLEDAKPSAWDAIDLLWGALKMQLTTWPPARMIVGFSILGALASVAISFALPVQYVARERVLVTPADESASVAANRLVQQSAFDRQSLASIIQECRLYPRERGRLSQDALIDIMARNIHVIAAPFPSSLYGNTANLDVQFDYQDPDVAKRVSERLIGLLMERNVHAEKSNLTLCVPDPPIVARLPKSPGSVRFACFGSLAGFLAGLLITGLIKWRTATSTPTSW
jgi:hypothetical protein